MRSSLLFLFLPLHLLALDLADVNDGALENETKAREDEHKLDCVKDIGVSPLPELRGLKPYYQIFILDLTAPMETFAKIRLLFVQAVCLYAAASNHIRIGYIALVNKHKVSSEPSIPDIREFIGMWTEPDEKLLNGVAKARQETPLTHCEKADLLGHIIQRFQRMTKKPFRFLIIDDQKSDDQTNINCDQAYEFGKALYRRNISLDNYILDEVVSRDQDHLSGRRMTKAPIFSVGSLDDAEAFLGGMKTYVETLQKPEAWSSEGLKNMIHQNEMALKDDEEEDDDPIAKDDVIIEFPHTANFTLGSEENMTNPDLKDDEEIGMKKGIDQSAPETSSASPNFSSPPLLVAPQPQAVNSPKLTTEYLTTTTNATTTEAAPAAAGLDWWMWLLIIVAILIILFILFIIFCCWYDKRKLKTKLDKGSGNSSTTPSISNNQTTPLIGTSTKKSENSSGSSSKRQLRLTKSNHVAESSPEGVGAPLVEKNLPDPYSPVKYINTPVQMPSDIEMTHTEHVAPPTMDEALNKHVVTPMEKVPELHIDDYNI